MLGIGIPELAIILVIGVVGFVLPLWISWKARPLGDKPYRFATYTALTFGVVAFASLYEASYQSGSSGLALSAGRAFASLVASIGIFVVTSSGLPDWLRPPS